MPFPHSDRSVSLRRGHRVQDASDPCCFLTQNAAFRIGRDIGHHDASDPFLSSLQLQCNTLLRQGHQAPGCLQPLLFIHSNHSTLLRPEHRHQDANDPCHFITPSAPLQFISLSTPLSHVQRNLHVVLSRHHNYFIIDAS